MERFLTICYATGAVRGQLQDGVSVYPSSSIVGRRFSRVAGRRSGFVRIDDPVGF